MFGIFLASERGRERASGSKFYSELDAGRTANSPGSIASGIVWQIGRRARLVRHPFRLFTAKAGREAAQACPAAVLSEA